MYLKSLEHFTGHMRNTLSKRDTWFQRCLNAGPLSARWLNIKTTSGQGISFAVQNQKAITVYFLIKH